MSTTVAAPATSIPLPVGRLAAIGAVIFFANAALLVLQLVAGRLLAPFIGSSLETWTSIIGVFLTGIALGNGYGGRIADRYPTPRTLAVLLALGAVAALWMLVFPLVLGSTGVHKSIPLTPRIPILAAALCLPAGFVLSLLTPLAIKLGLPDVSHMGRVAGLIFSLSTLGCLIGNYLTGFYLIPTFTINTLVIVSASVLIALSGVALLLPRAGEKAASEPLAVSQTASSTNANPQAFPDIRRAYLIVFIASFCGMTLELTASRVLAKYLGVSLFTWTGIIGVMLAGTALGNFTGGQIADRPRRGIAWLASAIAFFGTIALAIGLTLMATDKPDKPVVEYSLGIPTAYWKKVRAAEREDLTAEQKEDLEAELRRFHAEELPQLLPRLQQTLVIATVLGAVAGMVLALVLFRHLTRPTAIEPPKPRTVLATTLCAAGAGTVLLFVMMALITQKNLFTTWDPIARVMMWTFSLFFLPMFALGLVSPQVIRLSVPDVSQAGRVAGRVYAWSTCGAIAGTFAAGYVLLSTLGMNVTLLGASLVLVLASLLVTKVWEHNLLLYLFAVALGGVTGGFILSSRDREPNQVAKVESNYYTIRVAYLPVEGHPNALGMYLDLLLHSIVDPKDATFLHYTHEYTQVEFVRLARLEAPEPKVLVIGGGGYTFPRYLVKTMPKTHVDVVEIDPKVTEVAKNELGLEEFLDPKKYHLEPHHMDGRQFVAEKAAPGSYDLIVQDAVNDLSVPAHLMTKEYNDAVKAALKRDANRPEGNGVYLLTIIDSVADGKLWKAGMATLKKTFEHVELLRVPHPNPYKDRFWYASRTVLVIYASDRPFSDSALRDATYKQLPWVDGPSRTAALVTGTDFPGGGPVPAAARLGLAARANTPPILPKVHTVQADPALLKWFTDRNAPLSHELSMQFLSEEDKIPTEWQANREPGVVLTDQFCPIDNLMAEVFRKRER